MFTGIVSAVGTVASKGRNRLTVEHSATARRLRVGASVAVNGCCLTVVKKTGPRFSMDVVPETLRRTNLGALKRGSRVNLELPVTAAALLDGHIVQGHIDATGRVKRVTYDNSVRVIDVMLPATICMVVTENSSIS